MAGVLTWKSRFGGVFGNKNKSDSAEATDDENTNIPKWSMGVLNDPKTIEVPGSVLLLAAHRNEPLGLRNAPARTSHSSIPTGFPEPVDTPTGRQSPANAAPPEPDAKTTKDGIILNPQPEESANDPLNWPSWRRDCALLSLGFYCMVGGGMTPLLAAGFTNVAEDYHIETETVSLTTGLYMMGMGLGSVIFSPTAILYGKRPVYLFSSIIFILSSVWAALSPNFTSLILARIFQGIAVSPVECLPSATIAEIFFLHERAFRIGIYTLLLLGGKNLIPLVSALIIQGLGWRWTFWIVAMIVAFCGVLLFLFVPETFWDRTPLPKSRKPSRRPSFTRRFSSRHHVPQVHNAHEDAVVAPTGPPPQSPHVASHPHKDLHVGFAPDPNEKQDDGIDKQVKDAKNDTPDSSNPVPVSRTSGASGTPTSGSDYFHNAPAVESEKFKMQASDVNSPPKALAYTHTLRHQPAKSFAEQLKPWNGRLNHDSWFKVMLRPFVLFAYPAVLWSAAVYSLSVGWLIVVSESVALIYRNRASYNFDALQTGLVYLSPFVGGILGTAVAGKVSDIIVKAMARRNGGLYEPEFRLVMAAPVLVTTVIGLMGFGWSAQERDHWIVPTIFFGLISFGCTLGSTTSITFCVDSYRQYAGEALVTLNFSKNIFHGLVFSLFVTHWLTSDGPKMVFIWLGVIQLIFLFATVPMFIYGKRARMWTVRKNFMEKF
ncbi:major facilitator superfamily transporter [Colletotrichum scovillei]|uniref:Major facilitator superfamily transporter n=1 Tax=Colletotrichum scovillei TaxID=1209932 RepID=A0A9P7U7V0_9PEZI|nr:major facilitator superfamily transporter [Colletotrichum scovillei]KAF4773874.1 major facilitator superfamily transporter [Colletotrichum scovillei]KAG7038704.1 major facilitator superfamily transporter [Colletotrichum scovillei]KAG7040854.1 major facilitator superfamily transporter [Colletotrichum scovillei]KAG7060898.1 major facilitator superfamily transporter [Colletotrichum scovillei]